MQAVSCFDLLLFYSSIYLEYRYNLDGIDLEWATGISAAQFTTIATTIKTALGTSYSLSLSTPHDFWYLSGLNVVTIPLAAAVEFVSLITHNDTSPVILSPNAADVSLRASLTEKRYP